MNQPYARVNQPYATLTLASALREMFGVELYKNNARALLSRILSILNLDWLQHARSVRGVYESPLWHKCFAKIHNVSLLDWIEQWSHKGKEMCNPQFTSRYVVSFTPFWIELHQIELGQIRHHGGFKMLIDGCIKIWRKRPDNITILAQDKPNIEIPLA